MRIDFENRKWIGREGWNIRLKLQVWKNIRCVLTDPRGFESSGYHFWEAYKDEQCFFTAHSKKEMKQHLELHKRFEEKRLASENV